MRDGRYGAEVFDLQEGDGLVERALGVELQLAVLIGYAQRLDRRGADVAGLAVQRHVLAQRLRPQLRVPVGNQLQAVGIRHHDGNVHALLHTQIHQTRLVQRGVLGHIAATTALVHPLRARNQCANVDVAHGRRQQTHGAQLGEASAHAVRNVKRLKALGARQFNQEALGLGGGDDDVLLIVVRAGFLQLLEHDQILAHRFGGAAGLGDHVEARGTHVHNIHQRGHALGVDVVLDVELGRVALFLRQLVVVQMIQRLLNRRRAERASADAQHDERVKLLADALRGFLNLRHNLVLIVGQIHPTLHALAAPGLDGLVGVRKARGQRVHFRAVNAALAQKILHHMIDVQPNVRHESIAPLVIFLRYYTHQK